MGGFGDAELIGCVKVFPLVTASGELGDKPAVAPAVREGWGSIQPQGSNSRFGSVSNGVQTELATHLAILEGCLLDDPEGVRVGGKICGYRIADDTGLYEPLSVAYPLRDGNQIHHWEIPVKRVGR